MSVTPSLAAFITQTGVLKGTDKRNIIYTFGGPFTRMAQKEPGPPFILKAGGKLVKIVEFEESSFLFQRTKDWIRSLPVEK